MKKVIFISALAIAAAVSCTKSDIVDTKFNEQISFETYNGRDAMTKAAVTNNGNIKDFEIGLYGYYTGAKEWNAAGISNPSANLWDGTDALAWGTPEGKTVAGWYTSEDKYWTNGSDYYSFLAYAPMVGTKGADGITVTGTAANEVNVTYTTPVAEGELSTSVDLLYAQVVNTTKNKCNGKVSLEFKHALSRVTVKATAPTNNMGIQFDVKNVTLKGFFNTSATLNLATAAVGETVDSGWDVEKATRTNASYVFYNDVDSKGDFNPAAIGTDGKATDALTTNAVDYAVKSETTKDYLMMIPTTFTTEANKTATLSVTYTTIYGGNESNPMTKELPIAIDFRMGKAYALELAFTPVLDVITFDVKVEEWQPTTGEGDNVATDEIEKSQGNPEDVKDGWTDVTNGGAQN